MRGAGRLPTAPGRSTGLPRTLQETPRPTQDGPCHEPLKGVQEGSRAFEKLSNGLQEPPRAVRKPPRDLKMLSGGVQEPMEPSRTPELQKSMRFMEKPRKISDVQIFLFCSSICYQEGPRTAPRALKTPAHGQLVHCARRLFRRTVAKDPSQPLRQMLCTVPTLRSHNAE